MLQFAAVLTLGGLCLWEHAFDKEKRPDLGALLVHALLDNSLVEGRWEHEGQAFEWLVDSNQGLLLAAVAPRVASGSLRVHLVALRHACDAVYASDRAASRLGGSNWRRRSTDWDNALVSMFESPDAVAVEEPRALKSAPRVSGTTASKNARDWSGQAALPEAELSLLDFSDKGPQDSQTLRNSALPSTSASRTLTELETTEATGESQVASFFSRIGSAAGLKAQALSAADLAPALAAMQDLLMRKNVAREVAEDICQAVGAELVGKKVNAFAGGIKGEVQRVMETHLTRLLTPKTSNDILAEALRKRRMTSRAAPYVLTFVGVNGVGKSTNLSKVAFWLLQNNLRVLIAACDTFRSGAVEQLRTHVRNLGQTGTSESVHVALFERGYGKDAAGIAKEAIAQASRDGFDVVLIDTAGRMQDNEPLMRALAKLVSVNAPDKIVFVGEALVGNEALDQLRKFDGALRRFSGLGGQSRGIDAILLTKWDTIDDKVGAAVSMTAVVGCPLLAVGVGQTYSDLRTLKIKTIVNSLLR